MADEPTNTGIMQAIAGLRTDCDDWRTSDNGHVREIEDILRQQQAVNAATTATLAGLNASIAALNVRLDGMNQRQQDFDNRLSRRG